MSQPESSQGNLSIGWAEDKLSWLSVPLPLTPSLSLQLNAFGIKVTGIDFGVDAGDNSLLIFSTHAFVTQ